MGVVAERWIAKYRSNHDLYVKAAAEAKKQVEDALAGQSLNIHLIEARAKDPDSVAEKVERQKYGRPSQRFDDLIGVRIITLFDHSVSDVAKRLRPRFNVDNNRSSDKTANLTLRQVGYRSHHLVVRTRNPGLAPVGDILRATFIEIQIRSVISHAWAEIEHSLRYKIGEGIPPELARRFDALAGTLELVDREFSAIEDSTVKLVASKAERYSLGHDLDDTVSTVQLLALLKAAKPSMRPLGPDKLLIGIEDAYRFSKILIRCGISTVGQVMSALKTNELNAVLDRYSELAANISDPDEASGVVVLGTIIGLADPTEFLKVTAFADENLREALGFPLG
jgi:ppGpp synthetase/RelA/SpoT-type nucleotidyltranferase